MEELKEAAKNCIWTHPQQQQQQKLFRNTQSTTNHCKKYNNKNYSILHIAMYARPLNMARMEELKDAHGPKKIQRIAKFVHLKSIKNLSHGPIHDHRALQNCKNYPGSHKCTHNHKTILNF